jgi:hypothetical protein
MAMRANILLPARGPEAAPYGVGSKIALTLESIYIEIDLR